MQSVKQEAFKVTWPTKREVLIGSAMVFVLATIILAVSPVVDVVAQDFSDDPLMLNESDEFGFEQFGGDDFQSDVFGTQPAQDFFEPSDSQSDLSLIHI